MSAQGLVANTYNEEAEILWINGDDHRLPGAECCWCRPEGGEGEPCPRCGGFVHHAPEGGVFFWHECEECGCGWRAADGPENLLAMNEETRE